MRHGKDKIFSTRGIQIAVQYWMKNGHRVICFLPEYLFNYDEVGKNKRLNDMGMKATKASKLPDSVSTLNRLLEKGVMVKTPAQDYDDSYCISYARQANAFIVTNDKFRDYLRKIEVNPSMNDQEVTKRERAWIQQHSISFAFNEDEFLPNPDSKLFSKFKIEDYKSY